MTDKSRKADLILVGAVSRDEMIFEQTTEKCWGGAVVYGSVSAARSGARVRVITKAAVKDSSALDWYEADGIPVKVLPSRSSTSIRNIYHTPDRERRTCIPLGISDPFTPVEVEDLNAPIIYAAALMKGEIPAETLAAMARSGALAVDVQGFVRVPGKTELTYEAWKDHDSILPRVTYLKADGAEAQILTGFRDVAKAARAILDMGPREVVITHGSQVTLGMKEDLYTLPLTHRKLDGRTGRGDTLFASYLARRALKDSPKKALEFAAVLTSMKLEVPGPYSGSFEDVVDRLYA